MGVTLIARGGDEAEITKGKGKDTTQTTTEPLPMYGPQYDNETNKRPMRGVNTMEP